MNDKYFFNAFFKNIMPVYRDEQMTTYTAISKLKADGNGTFQNVS